MKNGIVAAEKSRILRESGGRGDDLDAPAVKLDGSHRGEFFSETYPIPAEALAVRRDGKVRVTFAATNGGLAGGLFDLRLMKAE